MYHYEIRKQKCGKWIHILLGKNRRVVLGRETSNIFLTTLMIWEY